MNKKAVEITMATVVIAAMCILVLVVLVLVFRSQIGSVSESFTGISDDAGEKAEESMWDLNSLFGCKKDETKCRVDKLYKCVDDEWVETTQPCEPEKKEE